MHNPMTIKMPDYSQASSFCKCMTDFVHEFYVPLLNVLLVQSKRCDDTTECVGNFTICFAFVSLKITRK